MLQDNDDSVLVAVRVIPRAARAEIVGERAGRLVVRVPQPPLEGRANVAVRNLLANASGVAVGRVQLVSGERGRNKLVRIEGISLEEAARRLA